MKEQMCKKTKEIEKEEEWGYDYENSTLSPFAFPFTDFPAILWVASIPLKNFRN